MKITKQKLIKIIKEELEAAMGEALGSSDSLYADMMRPENVRAYFQAQLDDEYSLGMDGARRAAQTLPSWLGVAEIEAAKNSGNLTLDNYMEVVLKHMRNPVSDREYLYGEPDRGAGDRGRYRRYRG
jgi:hypothetical protein